MSDNVEYISQDFDFLGSLSRNLRDLQGYDTLAYELIQNADDVKDDNGNPAASKIIFDICDDALIVENDGTFREVDFARMTRLASEGKRDEADTTGAFGIGFTVVYQITDTPELFSGGYHWRFVPINYPKNIESRKTKTIGTVFRLPYAVDSNSMTRQRLKQPAFDLSRIDELQQILSEAIFFAALFLKQLQILEVRRSGEIVRQVKREVDGNRVLITDNDVQSMWYLLDGDFEDELSDLRSRFPIEAKRHGRVTVAIPREHLEAGRLFAILPTNTITGLPFHINADFYPKSDRKQIIFESDYQSEWNRTLARVVGRIILANFEEIKDLFGYQGIWKFLQNIKDCGAKAERGELDRVFLDLWYEIKGAVSKAEVVFDTTNNWLKPRDSRLIQQKDEHRAIFIFEDLGISIAHEELSSHHDLLQEFGVRPLTVECISERLTAVGLDKPQPISNTLPSLQAEDNWRILWSALDVILDRTENVQFVLDRLKGCAIFLDDYGNLHLASQVYKGDERTKGIFSWLRWLTDTDNIRRIPGRLVDSFTVNDAINELSKRHDFENAWKNGEIDLAELFKWFQDHHRDFERYSFQNLDERLRKLPIYPVAGSLHPLSQNLYIPSDFEDPLGATNLIDLMALGNRKEFLKELGVQELTLETYVREVVPQRFEPKINLTWEQFRKLVKLLATRLGTLRDTSDLRNILLKLPLIECSNEKCARPSEVYLNSDVRQILGDEVLIAVTPTSDAIREFYVWLGVAVEPRTKDIVKRVLEITSSDEDFERVVGIVAHLFDILASHSIDDYHLDQLRRHAWLPARQQGKSIQRQWFSPAQLYSVFQEYLFVESDAYFLDFDRRLQTQTTNFARQLGIKLAPTPDLVVQHLLRCITTKKALTNLEVYRFLNDAMRQQQNPEWLSELKGTRCIWINNIYVKPDFVYWGEHPFGEFRAKLSRDWSQYEELLAGLGVKESPDFHDYCEFLYELEAVSGDQPIDENSKQIVYRCWRDINQLLVEQQLAQDEVFEALSEHRVIPNLDNILTSPVNILFKDRPDIAKKFDNTILTNIITKGEGSWRAMQAAGVRLLSEAVQSYIVELKDPIEDQLFAERIRASKMLFKRVLDAQSENDTREQIEAFFMNLIVKRVTEIAVEYELDAFGGLKSLAEYVWASWQADENILYYCDNDDDFLVDVARELAFALYPSVNISAWIEIIIRAETTEKARMLLDRQGCSPAREEYEYKEFSTDDLDEIQHTVIADENLTELQPQYSNENSPSFLPSQQKTDNQVSANKNQIPDSSDNVDRNLPNQEGESSYRTSNSNDHKAQQPDSNLSQNPGKQESTNVDRESQKHSAKNRQSNLQDDERRKSKTPASNDVDKAKKRRPSGKLRSYVTEESDFDDSKTDSESATRRSEVDQAGIKRVLEFERKSGRKPQEMPHHNVGFDVKSSDNAGKTRYIEVKSLSGDWNASSPAALTKAQFETARERGNAYWLYVVERALSSTGHIYRIQNPAQRINQYLFDDGWQAVDDEEA